MEEKLKNSMRFYMLATQLKYKIRSGWDKSLYYDDEDFARLLDYVRTINTQELLK